MKNSTGKFSFILKPSTIVDGCVGVFAVHSVAEGAYMEVFSSDFKEEICDKEDIPEELQGYCLDQERGKILCPKFFNKMDIGNYLNHSAENANLRYEKGKGYFAARNIQKGEELLADYRQLDEPVDTWAEYYDR